MSEFVGYYNGEWMPMDRIAYDPSDLGPSKGDQVFETIRTFGGKSFRMKEHVDRLYRSLKYVRIDPGLTAQEMLDLSEEGIERNKHLLDEVGDSYSASRNLVTRGPGGPRAWSAGPPNVYIKYGPNAIWYEDKYVDGLHGVITRTRSYDAEALDPKLKHLSRMNMSIAELEANDLDPGAWPILTDKDGYLTEGSGYNVFIVTDGVLRTPTERAILAGVSRGMVLDLADGLGLPAKVEHLQPYDAYTADEALLHEHAVLRPAGYVHRQTRGGGREAGSDHDAASCGVERGGRHRHHRPGDGVFGAELKADAFRGNCT